MAVNKMGVRARHVDGLYRKGKRYLAVRRRRGFRRKILLRVVLIADNREVEVP